jgi:ABC-type phosphate/phosphonate transport system permease subunit
MKIALKYGLLITLVVVLWIVIVRLWLGLGTGPQGQLISGVLFNAAAILAIFLGMRERKRAVGGALRFKDGVKTGMAISLVYAISACLFFMIEYLVAGPKLILSEAGPQNGPLWQVVVMAYAGLFLGSLFFGLIYSTLIAFFLARRLGRDSTEII